MINVNVIRYKINGFGMDSKVVNLYFNLAHLSSKDIKDLDDKIQTLRTTFPDNNFGFRTIHAAKSLNVWFLEDGSTAQKIKAILDDFVSNTALCLLYTQDEKQQYQFLSALLMKIINAEGAKLELI